MAVVNNKSIIITDRQGLTSEKVEICIVFFKPFVMYSSKKASAIGFNVEMELWTRVKFKLRS